MVEPINILGFSIKRAPKDLKFQSYASPITIPAGQTRTINYPTEFGVIATSVAIQNTDGANDAVVIINGGDSFTVANGSPVSMGDLWVVQITVTAGIAGPTLILAQQVPFDEVR